MFHHIYLTGYRGTGKTSVGRRIAHHQRLPLVDLDEKIEHDSGKSIREIFDEGGETRFRDLESAALQQVAAAARAVISLGGGTILRPENRKLICASGICLWLDAEADVLAARIAGDHATAQRRPSLTSRGLIDEIAPLLAHRRPLYQEVATARIDTTGKSVEEVAAEALRFL